MQVQSGAGLAFDRTRQGDGEVAPAQNPAAQAALTFDDAAPVALVDPVKRAGRPPGTRSYKTNQLVAYLSARGKLPAEVMHDVIRGGWRRLQRDLGCDNLAAFDRWSGLMTALLPYTAPKLNSLEVKGDAAAAGGLAALHLLAAQALGHANDEDDDPDAPHSQSGVGSHATDIIDEFGALPAELPTE